MTQRAIDGDYIYFVTTITTFRARFFDTPERAFVLGEIIQTSCAEFQFTLYEYCIMPDHVHLLVKKSGVHTVSRLMKHIKGRYWRVVSGGKGSRFWQPRFNFRIITNERRLENTVNYIQYNFRKHDLSEEFGKPPFVFIDINAIYSIWDPPRHHSAGFKPAL